jgi:hypothetical protein
LDYVIFWLTYVWEDMDIFCLSSAVKFPPRSSVHCLQLSR